MLKLYMNIYFHLDLEMFYFFSSLTTISIFKLTTAETSHLPAHSCQFHHRRGHFVKKSVTNSLLLLL